MSDLYESKRVRARKQHWCEDCGTLILPGTEYQRAKWLDTDGHFMEYASCYLCFELARDMFRVGFIGEDEWGMDCYPYLPDVDYWPDVRALSSVWEARVVAYLDRCEAFRARQKEARHLKVVGP